MLEMYLKKYNLINKHGVAMCFSDKKGRHSLYFGKKNSQNLIDENTLFQMASLSKLVASIVIVQYLHNQEVSLSQTLYDRCLINIDKRTTIKNLLSHSAGINVSGFRGYNKKEKIPSLVEIINGTSANSLPITYNLEFGKYSYSGGGYCLAQHFIEELSKKSLNVLANEILFKPLGLEKTTYDLIFDNENCASGYYLDGSMVDNSWHLYPEGAAAGLWSSVNEYVQILEELIKAYYGESKVIKQSVAQEILTPEVENLAEKNQYCLGCAHEINTSIFWHTGSNQGFKCKFVLDLAKREIIVVTTNDDSATDLLNKHCFKKTDEKIYEDS